MNRIVIVAAAAGVIAAAAALWRQFEVSDTVREQLCRGRTERCSQTCETERGRQSSQIQADRITELTRHLEASRECEINFLLDRVAREECHVTEDARHDTAERDLDIRQKVADTALATCHKGCCDDAARRGCPCQDDSSLGVGRDTSVVIECIDDPHAPCFHDVPDFCQHLGGVCDRCELTLCGDPGWTLEGELLVDTTLVAAGGAGAGRTLATAAARDGRATLAVPRDIKLQPGEKLRLGFRFSGPLVKTRKVTLHRER